MESAGRMKTIGLIGGMSWESTQTYYRLINQRVNQQCGGFHSAKIIVNSVDFAPIVEWQKQGDWPAASEHLAAAAKQLQAAGCDFFAIATNTMHLVADAVQAAVSIPLLHIAEPTKSALQQRGIKHVALLGTRFTMEKAFYKDYLRQFGGITSLIPNEAERETIHRIIYEELCRGDIRAESRQRFVDIISRLKADGAEALILGCTEIGLLIAQQDSELALFDTTQLHAFALADRSLR